jgi:very-short-patch-repair endonuclease
MSNEMIPENVWQFIFKASDLYGKFKEQSHSQEMQANCLELEIKSPIEQMFWVACNTLCASRYLDVNPDPFYSPSGELKLGCGIFIQPQRQVGSYRVDFFISQNGIGPDEILKPVVVELDGHDFHDKDKRQRSYEKARDRFLVKSGLRVLHFTGSDVVADPFKVAFEALELVGFDSLGGDKYNPADPLDLGMGE